MARFLPSLEARLVVLSLPGLGVQPACAARAFSSAAAEAGSGETPSFSDNDSSKPPFLVVFGGNGYVGSRVVKAGLDLGLDVVSISRRGRPAIRESWVDVVKWVRGDALRPDEYADSLEGAIGAVSTVGAFGSNAYMLQVCGEANIRAIRAAKERGVPRFAFISAHDFGLPFFFLQGYVEGKKKAEQALFEAYPEGGVVLRPGFIHGTRSVGSLSIPLGLVGSPLETLLSAGPVSSLAKSLAKVPTIGSVFVPPVKVETVGKAAVAAATDPSVPPGVMDVYQIQQYN